MKNILFFISLLSFTSFAQQIEYSDIHFQLDIIHLDTIYQQVEDHCEVIIIDYEGAYKKSLENKVGREHTIANYRTRIDLQRPNVYFMRNSLGKVTAFYNVLAKETADYIFAPIGFHKKDTSITIKNELNGYYKFFDLDSIRVNENGEYERDITDNSGYSYFPRGLVDCKGRVVIPAYYSDISAAGDGFIVNDGKNYNYLNAEFKQMNKKPFKHIALHKLNTNLLHILTEKGWGIMNLKGKILVRPKKTEQLKHALNNKGKRLKTE